MRVIVHFQLRGDWWLHCSLEDACTAISPWIRVRVADPPDRQATLYKLLRYVGADDEAMAEVEKNIRWWHRGSVHITLTPGRRNLLRIRPPWNEGLE